MAELAAAIPSPSRSPLQTEKSASSSECVALDHSSMATLYAGDLDPEVTEEDLLAAFHFIGPIASVRICRDSVTRKSLRYAYINFFSVSHASKALACLNHTELKGKPMRLMWSQRDPLLRKTGVGNLFVKNIDPSVTDAQLEKMFSTYGNVLSCKIVEENGASKGFGFVQFDSAGSATDAINHLHNTVVKEKKLYVSKFVKRSERVPISEALSYTNLFVKNLGDEVTEDLLRDTFSPFGKISSVAIVKDPLGKSKGFGFVKYESPLEAKRATEALNGSNLGSRVLSVERARQKDGKDTLEKFKNSNLCVKNLDTSVNEDELKQLFSSCGKIISARIIRSNTGESKGFGFVCFSTNEEAMRAIKKFHGAGSEGKSLHLTFARKDYGQVGGNDQMCATSGYPPVHYGFSPSLVAPKNQSFNCQFDNGFGLQQPDLLNNYMHQIAQIDPMKALLQKYQASLCNSRFT